VRGRAVLAAAIALSSAPAGAQVPGPIAFVRGPHVFAIDPVGGVEVQVTTAAGKNRHPRYSPDGTRLLYSGQRAGRWDLYVSAADGSGEVALTADEIWERDARWSPDGSNVVYSAGDRLWTVDVATLQVTPVTTAGQYNSPRYSPDGTRIVAVNSHSERDSSVEVVAETGAVAPIADASGYEFWPSWSPDGTTIAYARRSPNGYRVWVVSADGAGAARVTAGPGDDIEPLFSPTSDAIAFIRIQDELSNLFVHDRTMGLTTRITTFTDGGPRAFTWSPDGAQVAFTYDDRDGRPDIYVVGADGSGLRRLTTTGAGEIQLDWGSTGG
jgi:Tol biopolymer transport system component